MQCERGLLGLVKNAVNALDRQDKESIFLQRKLPQISVEKSFKADIYDGPQIWELMKGSMFDDTLSAPGLSACRLLKSVIANFLGSKQNADCEKEVDEQYEEIFKTRRLHVIQNALSKVPLRLSPLELRKLK